MPHETQITIRPGEPTISIKRIFDAPRQLVFEAWTNSDHIRRWYDPEGFNLDCMIDLRVGGKWRVFLQAPDGQDIGFGGEFREISPPGRLVHALHYDSTPHTEIIETLEFIEDFGMTTLTSRVVHTSVENRDRHVRLGGELATRQLLDRLANHLHSPSNRAPVRRRTKWFGPSEKI
jgi:uncharacterized protein YndB with AHSA1/START domain